MWDSTKAAPLVDERVAMSAVAMAVRTVGSSVVVKVGPSAGLKAVL